MPWTSLFTHIHIYTRAHTHTLTHRKYEEAQMAGSQWRGRAAFDGFEWLISGLTGSDRVTSGGAWQPQPSLPNFSIQQPSPILPPETPENSRKLSARPLRTPRFPCILNTLYCTDWPGLKSSFYSAHSSTRNRPDSYTVN